MSTRLSEARDEVPLSRSPDHGRQTVGVTPDPVAGPGSPGKTAARSRTGRLALGVSVAVLIAALVAWYVQRDAAPVVPGPVAGPATPTAVALTVALITPQVIRWPDEVTASGAITAWQEALVSAEVSGLRLSQIAVDVGDQVTRGQVLARFDDAMMQSAVAQQRALVEQAEARLAEAEANARRAQSLRTSAAISEQDLIQAVTRAQAAEAELKSTRARLESANLNLKFTTVVAPDDGVISARSTMLGAVAAPGAELFRLVRQNRLEWRAELTGAQLLRVTTGQQATLTLPDGSTAVGVVRQVAPVLDSRSRTGIVYVELDRVQSPSARAGMFASGVLVAGEREGIAIPASSVVLRDGHQFVFMVGADTRVEAVKVQTGRREGELVEVTEGLEPGTRIVGTGAAFLNSGDPVRVVDTAVTEQG